MPPESLFDLLNMIATATENARSIAPSMVHATIKVFMIVIDLTVEFYNYFILQGQCSA